MATIEEKLEAIDIRFRNPSKQRDAARYIVRQNRKITSGERKAICQEIPIKKKTLQGLFTELRKMDLYPPQKISDISHRSPTPEKPEETSHHAPDDPMPPQPEYATKEDFETLRSSITNLASLYNEGPPSNPGEEHPSNPEITVADLDEIAEVTDPSMDLELENPLDAMVDGVIELEGSIISRKSVGFTPKSLMLYDLTRKKGFRGNFADFVNSCISSALKGRNFKLTVVEDVE